MKTPQTLLSPCVLSDVPPTVAAAVRWTHFNQSTEISHSPSPLRGSDNIHSSCFSWVLHCHQDSLPTHVPGAYPPPGSQDGFILYGNVNHQEILKLAS